MECSMMVNYRNYSHCPPKKRPLEFYTYDEIDDEQPQDLRVKRRRNEDNPLRQTSSPPTITHTPPPTITPPHTTTTPQYPTSSTVNQPTTSPHLLQMPPSPPQMPSLANFYLQLFQKSALQQQQEQQQQQQRDWLKRSAVWPLYSPAHPSISPSLSTPSPLVAHLAAHLSTPHTSEERLASPRSTASEDSGMGAESLSEDEIDVTGENDACLRSPDASTGRSEARYSCTECTKSYSTYSGLSKHKQFHCTALGAKSFACKHCDKVYTSLGALKMHIRTHTLPCKCHLCGKAFSRPWLLQGHIRTHTGEKPFQCPQCDRCFADRSNLRAHLQTHAHVKKYACNTCHKTFSRMSLLNKHSEAACPSRPQHQQQH